MNFLIFFANSFGLLTSFSACSQSSLINGFEIIGQQENNVKALTKVYFLNIKKPIKYRFHYFFLRYNANPRPAKITKESIITKYVINFNVVS